MGKLKDKAREIRDEGAESRKNFTPEEDTAPLRMYQYWLDNSLVTPPKTENFCHYWRVVLIWGPLTWLRVALTSKTGAVLIVAAWLAGAAALIVLADSHVVTAMTTLGAPYIAGGIILGVMWFTDEAGPLAKRLSILFAPVVLLFLAVAYAVRAIFRSRPLKLLSKHADTVIPAFFIGIAALLLIFLVVATVIEEGWIALFIGIGMIGALIVAVGVVLFIIEYFASKRAKVKKARRAEFDRLPPEERIEILTKSREPSRIRLFFQGVGDFIVLIAQAVRVNKWKICPIVIIPTSTRKQDK